LPAIFLFVVKHEFADWISSVKVKLNRQKGNYHSRTANPLFRRDSYNPGGFPVATRRREPHKERQIVAFDSSIKGDNLLRK